MSPSSPSAPRHPDSSPTPFPPQLYTLIENFCLGTRRLELFSPKSTARRGWVTVGPDDIHTNNGPVPTRDKLTEQVIQEYDAGSYGQCLERLKDEMGRYVLPQDYGMSPPLHSYGSFNMLTSKSCLQKSITSDPSPPSAPITPTPFTARLTPTVPTAAVTPTIPALATTPKTKIATTITTTKITKAVASPRMSSRTTTRGIWP